MSKEINLKKIVAIVKSNIVIILVVSVLLAAAAGVYTKFTVVPRYSSVIKFCLRSDIQISSTSGADERNQHMYANELMSTCVETLEAGDAYDEMNKCLYEFNNKYESIVLTRTNVSIVQNSDVSNIISVIVTTTNPQLSYDACLAFESMATKRVTKVGKLTLEKIDSPVIASTPISSGIERNCVLSFGLGFMITTLFFLIKAVLDNTVKDGAAVCEELGILLLAEIPDICTASEAERLYNSKISSAK